MHFRIGAGIGSLHCRFGEAFAFVLRARFGAGTGLTANGKTCTFSYGKRAGTWQRKRPDRRLSEKAVC